ncbi:MAG: DUF3298 domain-containing protein, partial [Oscillospiraceae bacterium]|nr:DUF3298 domain-containing protein [Oscillospiraceae bacterium]
MKRFFYVLLALCLTLSLAACAKKPLENCGYRVKLENTTREEKTEDGAAIFTMSCELPYLAVVDEKGSTVTDRVPENMADVQQTFADGVRADIDTLFNYDDMVSEAKQELADSETYGYDYQPRVIEVKTPEVLEKEHFVSAYANGYVSLGGAHPWYLIRAWNFDLDRGEFVTWEDLTDEDDAMRAFLADQIFAQIDEQGLREYFFDDMESVVRTLAYTQMYFDDSGLNILFEEESIGPHAAGIPAFAVPYDQLMPYLNERALTLLELDGTVDTADPLAGGIALAQGMPAYRAVLQEGGTFFSTDAGCELTLEEIDKALADYDDITVTVKEFAVADLDDDGKQEVILALDTGFDGFFEVLHEKNGTVYGYSLVYRAMQALKENGLIAFSSGAADSGFGRLHFAHDGYELVPVTYSESHTDSAGNFSVSFFVDGESTDEDAFQKEFDAFWQLPDAEWHAFSSENV